jgi:hypothetical protein
MANQAIEKTARENFGLERRQQAGKATTFRQAFDESSNRSVRS